MIKKSLAFRVLAISFIVLALPLLIDTFIFFQYAYEDAVKDSKRELKDLTNYRAYSIYELEPVKNLFLDELIYLLGLKHDFNDLNFERIQIGLEGIAAREKNYGISILGIGKNLYEVLASSNSENTGKIFMSYRQLEKIVEEGQSVFFRYRYLDEYKRYVPILYIARLIRSELGHPVGIILVFSNMEEPINELLAKGGEKNRVNFALLSDEGIVIAATDPALVRQFFLPISSKRRAELKMSDQFGDTPLAAAPLTILKEQGEFFQFLFQDQIQLAYKTFFPKIGISLMAYSPKENLFGSSIRHFVILYVVYGLILILGASLTVWLNFFMSRPLRQLSNLIAKVSAGNLDVRFKEEPFGFEINILGNRFNQTLNSLLENIQKAEDERVMKETYRQELRIGQEVQRNLLPETIKGIEGIEIAEVSLPAVEVGGDFYDVYIRNQTGRKCSCKEDLILTIADAAGKGVSACMYALGVRGILRAYSAQYEDVADIVVKTNDLFLKDTGDSGMFVSANVAIYHPNEKKLNYYSCGHVPGIIRRANGHLVTLSHTGMALGLKKLKGIASETIQLYSGDILLFYSDGLISAVNEKNQFFSLSRLHNLLQQRGWESAKEIATGLKEEVLVFIGEISQNDDITIVVMKVL